VIFHILKLQCLQLRIFYIAPIGHYGQGFSSVPAAFLAEGQGFSLLFCPRTGKVFFQADSLPNLRREKKIGAISIIHILGKWVLAGFLFPSIEFCVSLGRRLLHVGLRASVPNFPSGNANSISRQRNPSKTHFFLGVKLLFAITAKIKF
jgi:hypothetical protein